MQQIKHRNCINVFGFLKHIRQQRNFLVQTEEQYIFIHDALMEFLDAGDTEVPSTHLLRYLQTLNSIAGEKNSTIIFPVKFFLICSTTTKRMFLEIFRFLIFFL